MLKTTKTHYCGKIGSAERDSFRARHGRWGQEELSSIRTSRVSVKVEHGGFASCPGKPEVFLLSLTVIISGARNISEKVDIRDL